MALEDYLANLKTDFAVVDDEWDLACSTHTRAKLAIEQLQATANIRSSPTRLGANRKRASQRTLDESDQTPRATADLAQRIADALDGAGDGRPGGGLHARQALARLALVVGGLLLCRLGGLGGRAAALEPAADGPGGRAGQLHGAPHQRAGKRGRHSRGVLDRGG